MFDHEGWHWLLATSAAKPQEIRSRLGIDHLLSLLDTGCEQLTLPYQPTEMCATGFASAFSDRYSKGKLALAEPVAQSGLRHSPIINRLLRDVATMSCQRKQPHMDSKRVVI
jgi:hypothetical protein